MQATNPNFEMLEIIGELVYGEDWQTPVADFLGRHRRTINRWKNSGFQVPDEIDGVPLAEKLYELVENHERKVAEAKRWLRDKARSSR